MAPASGSSSCATSVCSAQPASRVFAAVAGGNYDGGMGFGHALVQNTSSAPRGRKMLHFWFRLKNKLNINKTKSLHRFCKRVAPVRNIRFDNSPIAFQHFRKGNVRPHPFFELDGLCFGKSKRKVIKMMPLHSFCKLVGVIVQEVASPNCFVSKIATV